ncbi:SusC/RagA family TonB-linked outer membrane protein [Flavitalea sp.]|nr:TonB-dependent receptor [Flavitalea sp.]
MRFKVFRSGMALIALSILFVSPATLKAQTTSLVKGKVQNSTGSPLAGVSVVIRNTKDNFTTGTSTDSIGMFTFSNIAPGGPYSFSFSSIGYDGQTFSGYTIQPGITLSLAVKMVESANASLDQVVVVGYGTKRKRDLTGSVSSVSGGELQKVPSSNFTAAMQGKVPGVFISQTSGAPGGASSVRIRGVGTTGNNQPLYVVDGVLMGGDGMSVPGSSYNIDPLSIINPNDIESVDVLKDAASAAIYGSRGANGVILVTTKRGKEGGGTVTLNASTGFAQLWQKPAFLNAEEFATMANELYVNSGLTPNPQWANPKSLGEGSNMIDEVFHDAPFQNYDFSVSGGTKSLKARLSLGYNDQMGTMIETWYKRYTGRATIDLKVGSRLNFGGSLAFASTESKGQNSDAMQGGIFNLAQQFFPTLNRDSNYFGDGLYYTKDGDNPILRANTIDNKLNNSRIYGNVFGELEIISGLKFRSSLGIDGNFTRTSSWQGKLQRGFYIVPRATLSENYDNRFNWLLDNTLSYSKKFGGHSLSAVIGQTSQKFRYNWISATGNDYLSEELQVINASDVSLRNTSGSNSNSTLASYFGRIDYSLNGMYLLSASLRRDGSSNFGPNNKWGYFPAVSAGWRISEESFMAPLRHIISDFKFRGSWGRVGNDNIPAFGYLSTIRSGTAVDNYTLGPGNQTIAIGSTIVRPGNPDLKWETTEQIDIGADVSFFEDKLYLTADYYKKTTVGMLISLPVSLEAGFQNSPTVNGGRVENKGWEFLLGYRTSINGFRFNLSGNIATLSNKVTSLGVGQPIVGPTLPGSSMTMTYTKEGEPIGYFRGYVVDGVYQVDADINKKLQPNAIAGDFIYHDVNSDGVLTDADKVKIGKPWPDFTYGLNADFSYKGFDLNVMFQGVSGSQIYRANKVTNYQMKYFNGNGIINGVKDILNHWTPGSGVNDQPGLKYTDANGNYSNASSFFVEDGDFLRLRNLVIGYNIPFDVLRRVTGNAFKSVRVYVNAQNLVTFTSYKGFDPEIGSTNPMNSGIDTGIYPQPRTYSGGISLNF